MNASSLKAAFGDCKRLPTSKCSEPSSYETVSYKEFYVIDDQDEEPVRIQTIRGDAQLHVGNRNEQEICLVKTDKCLFTNEHRKCDCILFGDRKIFLVEISNSKNKNVKRREAVAQLGITIGLLKDKNLILDTHDVKAIICFKTGQTRPLQASFNSQRAVFLDKYNVSLEEGNFIEF